ncbi:hypothetical protein ACFL4D_01440 [Candidatus Margulisiibacteriota bacterium]
MTEVDKQSGDGDGKLTKAELTGFINEYQNDSDVYTNKQDTELFISMVKNQLNIEAMLDDSTVIDIATDANTIDDFCEIEYTKATEAAKATPKATATPPKTKQSKGGRFWNKWIAGPVKKSWNWLVDMCSKPLSKKLPTASKPLTGAALLGGFAALALAPFTGGMSYAIGILLGISYGAYVERPIIGVEAKPPAPLEDQLLSPD